MAYQLKDIRYHDRTLKILLQNENGPCPLLAAANALLLRGSISLPSASVRSGCASLDEVINMLAEKLVSNSASNDSSHHHVNEVLDLLPMLQYGMDVNPTFTTGPSGIEFTSQLSAFDLLNVELVHGWLLDPQSTEIHAVIGKKSYNELVELVIRGSEATTELATLDKELLSLEGKAAEDYVYVEKSAAPTSQSESIDISSASGTDVASSARADDEAQSETADQIRSRLQGQVEEYSRHATVGTLIDSFLASTSHQLTQYGLSVLYETIAEHELKVFFRNNHFCTITKEKGLLYLLVTDLGYANVPNVVWEKLDVIDGDTEYVSSNFSKPAPSKDVTESTQGPNIDPRLLLAQRGQSEADYQLALQLAGNDRSGTSSNQGVQNIQEQEGKLIAAATEASLREYNGHGDNISPPDTGFPTSTSTSLHEQADRTLALQLQAQVDDQEASLQLARTLQQQDWQGTSNPGTARTTPQSSATAGSKSSCIIS